MNITEGDDAGITWTYGYDNANHLVQAQKWSEDPEEYVGPLDYLSDSEFKYDAFGNRIEKDVTVGETNTVTKFAIDGWNPAKASPVGNENYDVWADLTNGGSLATRYLRGDAVDQLFAEIGASTHWTLTDHLGSVRDVIDNSGAVLDSIAYDGFGNATESDATYGGRYKYTGRELDVETNLQYNRARYYDAATGRWISQDPMGFDAGDSNLYRYVNNQPSVGTDPSGQILIASGEAAKDQFLKEFGKKNPTLDLGGGLYYVHTDRSDFTDLFQYANKRWSAIWTKGQKLSTSVKMGEERDPFLRASGILGDSNAYEIIDIKSLKTVNLNPNQKKKLEAFRSDILSKANNPPKVVFDFGGEGRYDSEKSVNFSLGPNKTTTPGADRKNNAWYYIDYLKQPTAFIKDKSVDVIYCGSAPVVPDLFVRIIKPGGTIVITNEKSHYQPVLDAAKTKYPKLKYHVEIVSELFAGNMTFKVPQLTITIPK